MEAVGVRGERGGVASGALELEQQLVFGFEAEEGSGFCRGVWEAVLVPVFR